MRKAEVKRPYPPEFVSAATLAYLMDASERSIEEDVKRGFLPKPHFIGNKKRWHWPEVIQYLAAREPENDRSSNSDDVDEYDRDAKLVEIPTGKKARHRAT